MKLSNVIWLTLFIPLLIVGCKSAHDHDHLDIAGFRIIMDNEVIVQQTGTTISGSVSMVTGEMSSWMKVEFRDPDGHIHIINDPDFSLQVVSSNSNVASIDYSQSDKWSFRINAMSDGQAQLTVNLMHGNHADFESRPFNVTITAPVQQ